MAVTLSDIAKRAGASPTTVSRVLTNQTAKYRISKLTAKRVLKVAKDLNFKPNQLARGLRLKTTHTIGLVLPDISNPFFAYLTRNIQTVAPQMGYSLVVCNTDENLSLETEHIEFLQSKGVDGMIVMPVGQQSTHLERLIDEGVPLVLVDRCFERLEADSVVLDNYNGAFDAVEHLIEYGHRRIGIILGLGNTYSTQGRLQGYKDALKKHGVAVEGSLIAGESYRQETGYRCAKMLLGMQNPPSAIFATSDVITLGVLEAIKEKNLSIPQDISLLSFDDFDFAPYLQCPLTAIAQPKENMGEIAVRLLIDRMTGHRKNVTQRMVLKPNLVKRESVKKISAPVSALAASG